MRPPKRVSRALPREVGRAPKRSKRALGEFRSLAKRASVSASTRASARYFINLLTTRPPKRVSRALPREVGRAPKRSKRALGEILSLAKRATESASTRALARTFVGVPVKRPPKRANARNRASSDARLNHEKTPFGEIPSLAKRATESASTRALARTFVGVPVKRPPKRANARNRASSDARLNHEKTPFGEIPSLAKRATESASTRASARNFINLLTTRPPKRVGCARSSEQGRAENRLLVLRKSKIFLSPKAHDAILALGLLAPFAKRRRKKISKRASQETFLVARTTCAQNRARRSGACERRRASEGDRLIMRFLLGSAKKFSVGESRSQRGSRRLARGRARDLPTRRVPRTGCCETWPSAREDGATVRAMPRRRTLISFRKLDFKSRQCSGIGQQVDLNSQLQVEFRRAPPFDARLRASPAEPGTCSAGVRRHARERATRARAVRATAARQKCDENEL